MKYILILILMIVISSCNPYKRIAKSKEGVTGTSLTMMKKPPPKPKYTKYRKLRNN